MRTVIKSIAAVVYFLILFSCDNPHPPAGETGEDTLPWLGMEPGACWYLREFRDDAGAEELRYLYISKGDGRSFEGRIETFAGRGNTGYYDFRSRFYFLMDGETAEDLLKGRISGIKKGIYDSYAGPGDGAYDLMAAEMGFEELILTPDNDARTLTLGFPGGETSRLVLIEYYRHSWNGQQEHGGVMRDGTFSEYVDYIPMGDDFRFVYRFYFSYRNEAGGTVTLSSQYNMFGARSLNPLTQAYDCRIEGFSNNAYPRFFYGEGHLQYDRSIGELGFRDFTETMEEGRRIISAADSQGTEYSRELTPTPYP